MWGRSQWAGSPPAIQEGGNWADMRSCSSGSCGAISGANSATSTSAPTSAPPTQSRAPPRFHPAIHRDEFPTGRSSARSAMRSAMAQPRIKQRHREVYGEIERDEEHGKGQDQALDQGKVAIDHRVDRHVANAFIGENALDQHGTAEQERDLDAAERNGRDQRVGKYLAQQYLWAR